MYGAHQNSTLWGLGRETGSVLSRVRLALLRVPRGSRHPDAPGGSVPGVSAHAFLAAGLGWGALPMGNPPCGPQQSRTAGSPRGRAPVGGRELNARGLGPPAVHRGRRQPGPQPPPCATWLPLSVATVRAAGGLWSGPGPALRDAGPERSSSLARFCVPAFQGAETTPGLER